VVAVAAGVLDHGEQRAHEGGFCYSLSERSYEPHRTTVGFQLFVSREQHKTFCFGLRGEHTIERILVDVWKSINRHGMLTGQRKF
jgi:hypothetical protein